MVDIGVCTCGQVSECNMGENMWECLPSSQPAACHCAVYSGNLPYT